MEAMVGCEKERDDEKEKGVGEEKVGITG